jgi:hypothetical protein
VVHSANGSVLIPGELQTSNVTKIQKVLGSRDERLRSRSHEDYSCAHSRLASAAAQRPTTPVPGYLALSVLWELLLCVWLPRGGTCQFMDFALWNGDEQVDKSAVSVLHFHPGFTAACNHCLSLSLLSLFPSLLLPRATWSGLSSLLLSS